MDTKSLAAQFGAGIAEGAQLYLPAIARLGLNEFVAMAALVAEKKLDEAKTAIHDAMTPEEMAEEKRVLAKLDLLMADTNAEKRAIGEAIGEALIRAAIAMLLAVAFP